MMPATMPAASWLRGELRTFVRPALDHEGQRQRTVLQRVREALGLLLVEVAGDLGPAAGDRLVVGRVGQHLAVEHDRQPLLVAHVGVLLTGDLRRDVGELRGSGAVELDVDHVVADALLRDAVAGVLDVRALDHRGAEQVAVALVVTGDEWLARKVDLGRGGLALARALVRLQLDDPLLRRVGHPGVGVLDVDQVRRHQLGRRTGGRAARGGRTTLGRCRLGGVGRGVVVLQPAAADPVLARRVARARTLLGPGRGGVRRGRVARRRPSRSWRRRWARGSARHRQAGSAAPRGGSAAGRWSRSSARGSCPPCRGSRRR